MKISSDICPEISYLFLKADRFPQLFASWNRESLRTNIQELFVPNGGNYLSNIFRNKRVFGNWGILPG